MASRIIVALGGGLISSSGTAAASGAKSPERIFAIAGILYLLVFVIGHRIIPIGLSTFGTTSTYLGMMAYAICIVPTYYFLLTSKSVKTASSNFIHFLADAPYRLLGILALIDIFVYELGQIAVYIYMDKVGNDVGLDQDERGDTISTSLLIGISGGRIATWQGTRFGRFWPLMVGLGG